MRVTVAGRRLERVVDTIEQAIALRDELKNNGERYAGMAGQTLGDALKLAISQAETAGTQSWLRKNMAQAMKIIPANTLLSSIKTAHILDLKDRSRAAGLKPVSVNHRIEVMRHCLTVAINAGWIVNNVALSRDVPRMKVKLTRIDFFEPEEFRAVLGRIEMMQRKHSPRMIAVATVLANTGLRRSEMVRCRERDINLRSNVLYVDGKTAAREIPFSEDTAGGFRWLLDYHGDGFIAPRQPETLGLLFATWRKLLDEPRWKCHTMRHTAATSMLRNGVDVETVRVLMGHHDLRQTQRYCHVSSSSLRDAVESLQLRKPSPGSIATPPDQEAHDAG